MKNLFLPYELAVIAKEKGFNEKCLAGFDTDKEFHLYNDDEQDGWRNKNIPAGEFSAPLYQQIVDWFRIKKAISVEISWNEHMKMWQGVIQDFRDPVNTYDDYGTSEDYYTTYNAVITEAFKLIP
jgi:hypothetical protein